MRFDLLKSLNTERAARRAAVLITDTTTGEQRLVRGVDVESDALAAVLEPALRSGKSGVVEHDGRSWFLTVQVPPVRLVCIGAVHITQALAPIARVAGFDMIIVDPRTAFATPERFPDVKVIAEWPDVALPPLGIDRYTAMAFFTHDPKIDDPGLVQALRADCFYIGALGSRKTHARRVERMKAEGFTDEQVGRIHAPVGLDIGAVTPAEIAVSVLGEIIVALRKKPLRADMKTAEAAA
jgi:xanthine dehydrogenase accessory factor